MTLTYHQLTGSAIAEVIDELGALRIVVFREFPYLYDGSLQYEREYLQRYADCARAFLFLVRDGDQLVGATTCMPLENETAAIQQPFLESGRNLAKIMYFGESILLPAYRGLGLGHRFFDEREQYTLSLKSLTTACFCAVERPEHHPLKPADYRTNDAFWEKRGYQIIPHLKCSLSWQDLYETEETAKTLVFRIKQLK